MPRYTEHERQEMTKEAIRLYAEGYSVEQIRRTVGVPHQTVRGWMLKEGVKFRKPERANKIEYDLEKLKAMAGSGATLMEIGGEMHASTTTVRKWLKENGITINTEARKKEEKSDLKKKGKERLEKRKEKPKKKCRTCIYRSGRQNYGCNYIGAVGRSRRCPVIGCTKYVKGKRIRTAKEMFADV